MSADNRSFAKFVPGRRLVASTHAKAPDSGDVSHIKILKGADSVLMDQLAMLFAKSDPAILANQHVDQ